MLQREIEEHIYSPQDPCDKVLSGGFEIQNKKRYHSEDYDMCFKETTDYNLIISRNTATCTLTRYHEKITYIDDDKIYLTGYSIKLDNCMICDCSTNLIGIVPKPERILHHIIFLCDSCSLCKCGGKFRFYRGKCRYIRMMRLMALRCPDTFGLLSEDVFGLIAKKIK